MRTSFLSILGTCLLALTAACGDGTGGMTGFNSVVVNEVFPNGTAVTDPDWAELKNTGDSDADLSGWKVRDSNTGNLFTLPAGTVVAAGKYLIIYCDDQEPGGVAGGVHVPWKLSASNGDQFHLVGKDGLEVDAVTFGADVPADKSWGRLPDGTGGFVRTTPTRNALNF